MLDKLLAHRGPDDKGFLSWDGVTLSIDSEPSAQAGTLGIVHRRLMIQDTTAHGFQPMMSQDNRYGIVFNGEIYNFLELKAQLQHAGYYFSSQSDTEVLLVGYQHWGLDVFDKIEGMFAFALIDFSEQSILLARDPFGIKPLYYSLDERFCFASEINCIKQLGPHKINPQAVYETCVLNQCDSHDHTFYQGIYPVPAGHWLKFDLRTYQLTAPVPYWQLSTETVDISKAQAQLELKRLWHESMAYHQISSVPIGAALSGGIDSSLISATLAQSNSNLPTFSFVSKHNQLSEAKWIRLMADKHALKSYQTKVNSDEFLASFRKLIDIQGQPFGSLSILAQHYIYQLAKAQNIKVVLNGQGADELFAGYYRYLKYHNSNGRLQALGYLLRAVVRHGLYLPANIKAIMSARAQSGLIVPDWMKQNWFETNQVTFPEHVFGNHDLKSELKRSLQGSLLSLLRYDDLNAMHFGVETRLPFLYRPLVKFVMSLPAHFLIDDKAVTKAILRDSFSDMLPKAIMSRRDKIGFAFHEPIALPEHIRQEFLDRLHALPFVKGSKLTKNLSTDQMLYHKPYFRALCTSYYFH